MFKFLFFIVLGCMAYTYVISPEAKASFGNTIAEFVPATIPSAQENPIHEKRLEAEKQKAWIMAQYFVKKKLSHPGSSDFGSYDDGTVTDLGKGIFKANGIVDSVNAFGNQAKSEFNITMHDYGNGDWKIEKPVTIKEIK